MAWTYEANPSEVKRDEVRLLIGDTDPSDQQLQDGEIAYALAKYDDDAFQAAALCCRTLAAKYAREVDSSIESVRVSASSKHTHYFKLATQIEAEGRKANSSDFGVYVGGVTNTDYEDTDLETDRLQPLIREGQFDNPPGYGGR